MATISNLVKDSAGNLLSGTAVVELIIFATGNVPTSFQGFVDLSNVSTDFTINVAATVTIVNGAWSATVKGNAAIEDSYGASVSTFYKVSETTSGVTRTYYILVPDDSNSYWVGDLIAIDPGTVSSTITLDALSDVMVSSPSDGQVLQFEASSGLWKAVTLPGYTSAVYKDIISFAAPGILQAVTGTMAVVIPYAYVVTGVYLHVNGAPLGNRILCDANIDDTTIFTSVSNRRPRIATSEYISTQGVPSTGDSPNGSAGSVLSVDIDETGIAPNEGTDLTVSVAVTYT